MQINEGQRKLTKKEGNLIPLGAASATIMLTTDEQITINVSNVTKKLTQRLT